MMAYYPVKEDAPIPDGPWGETMFKNRNNTNIPIANEAVKKLADKFGYTWCIQQTEYKDGGSSC